MEFKAQVVCGYLSVFVVVSMCCLCDARFNNNDTKTTSTTSMPTSRKTPNKTDSSSTTSNQTEDTMKQINPQAEGIKIELKQYKSATITLAVLCSVIFLALTFLTMRYRAKSTSSKPADTPLAVIQQEPKECEYQSIRGLRLIRRETGNSCLYETVKPKLPPARPTIAYLIHASEGEYENLKSHVRDSDVYVPMNEALAMSELTGSELTGRELTGSTIVFSNGEEDLYLTMNKYITTADDASASQTNCDLENV